MINPAKLRVERSVANNDIEPETSLRLCSWFKGRIKTEVRQTPMTLRTSSVPARRDVTIDGLAGSIILRCFYYRGNIIATISQYN